MNQNFQNEKNANVTAQREGNNDMRKSNDLSTASGYVL